MFRVNMEISVWVVDITQHITLLIFDYITEFHDNGSKHFLEHLESANAPPPPI